MCICLDATARIVPGGLAIQMCGSQAVPAVIRRTSPPRCDSVTYLATRIVKPELSALRGFSKRRRREQFPYRPEIEDRISRYSFVPRQIGKPVIEKLTVAVHAHRYRNATALPFCSKSGRTFCATIASTFPLPRTGTAARKTMIRIVRIFV